MEQTKQPQSEVYDSFEQSWKVYIVGMEDALKKLEMDINEAADMSEKCTSEWCTATEHVIDDLSNSLFSIHEPRFTDDEDSKKIKNMKRKVHDLYAKYKSVAP